jgi:hypothetical protein
MNLLIHSMSELQSIILPALELAQPRNLVEIGSEHGGLTTVLSAWVQSNGGYLTSVDPSPSPLFREWAATASSFEHIEKPSLDAIGDLDDVDCWFIDGDHNWYTVYNELILIQQNSVKSGKPMLVFLHDVGWPCGRRDSYYAPERIPTGFRHPFSFEMGVSLDQGDVLNGGFRGMGSFAWATHEGGPGNGVLTAVEDFAVPQGDALCLAVIPAVFGLGVLFSSTASWAPQLAEFLMPYHEQPLMEKLEQNRLRNYLRVIALQDQLTQSGAG